MANEFKKCPNGHYYQGDFCPYCKSDNKTSKTVDPANQETEADAEATRGFNSARTGYDENATIVDDGTMRGSTGAKGSAGVELSQVIGRTIFGEEEEEGYEFATNVGDKKVKAQRESRKLVGWLVSYSLDPLGVDFKIYEGRNIIGRAIECNITVNDNWVSAKHAVLLFRTGKYSITDSQSSHGTFVNDKDIDLEPCYLSDGDMIKIGKTVFKFRSAF